MMKILWKRGEIALEEQFLFLSTIFCYLMLDFYVKTRIGFSLRDKRLFEITEVEITRVDCIRFDPSLEPADGSHRMFQCRNREVSPKLSIVFDIPSYLEH